MTRDATILQDIFQKPQARTARRPKAGAVTQAVRASLFALTATVVLCPLAAVAVAQSRPVVYELNIPREALDAALQDLARQAGLQVARFSDAVKGDTLVGPVKGKYSVDEALKIVLEPNGLTYRTLNEHAIVVLRPQDLAQLPVAGSPSSVSASYSSPASPRLAQAGQGTGGPINTVPQVTSPSGNGSTAGVGNSTDGVLEEIVVTANKRVEPLSHIGAGISAISGADLELMNANTVEDYLGFIPGIEFTSYGRPGQDQISIRGVASQSLGAAVATYVDEVPVGSTSNEAQGATYTVDIDPADLERVEVLKGPQGTLYGASSLGGVLKYVTKDPSLNGSSFETGVDVNDIDHGGVGYKARAAGTTAIVPDVLGVRLSGFYRDDAGFIDNVDTGAKDINSDHAYGLRGSLLFQPVEALRVKLGAVLQRTDSSGLDAVSYNQVPNFPPPFALSYGDLNTALRLEQPSQVIDKVYTAEIHYDLGWASLISATGVSREDIYRFTDVTASYSRPSYVKLLNETPGSTLSDTNNYDINKTTEEIRLQSASNDQFEWLAGLFYQDESSSTNSLINLKDAAGVQPPQPYGSPAIEFTNNDLKEVAEFADLTWYILPQLDVSGGYRHSHIEQHNSTDEYGFVFEPTTPTAPITRTDTPSNEVNTYSAGIRWRVTSDVMVYARAASGFRPGGGRGEPPVPIQNFVFSYNPDSIWSYETGVKAKALDGRLAIDVDTFYINWKNIQTLVDVGDGFLVQGNGGAAVSRGAEAQILLQPIRNLSLNAGLAYTDAHYTDPNPGLAINVGDPIQFVPKFTASMQANYSRALTDHLQVFTGADYRYRSSELDAIAFRLPAFGQWGVHAGADFGQTRVNLYAVNLADKRGLLGYTGGGNAVGDAFRYAVTPPRTIGISITQKW
jgi:outer membrane receptor protein involved in Fe transport